MYRITFLDNDNLPVGQAFYINDYTSSGEDVKIFLDKLLDDSCTCPNHFSKINVRKLEN